MTGRVDVVLYEPAQYPTEAAEALRLALRLQEEGGPIRTLVLSSEEPASPLPAAGGVRVGVVPSLAELDIEQLFRIAHAFARADAPADAYILSNGPLTQILARLAGALEYEALLDVVDARRDGAAVLVSRRCFGGKAEVRLRTAPRRLVLACTPGSFPEETGAPPKMPDEVVRIQDVPEAFIRDRTRQAADSAGLKDAAVVVSGGRGIGGEAGFETLERLASLLKGAVGASRAAVDEGWAKPEQQIGLTGVTVRPKVYVAVGISGASQHLAGMASSGAVLAINPDENAPIVGASDAAFIGDWHALWPLIQAKIGAAGGR